MSTSLWRSHLKDERQRMTRAFTRLLWQVEWEKDRLVDLRSTMATEYEELERISSALQITVRNLEGGQN